MFARIHYRLYSCIDQSTENVCIWQMVVFVYIEEFCTSRVNRFCLCLNYAIIIKIFIFFWSISHFGPTACWKACKFIWLLTSELGKLTEHRQMPPLKPPTVSQSSAQMRCDLAIIIMGPKELKMCGYRIIHIVNFTFRHIRPVWLTGNQRCAAVLNSDLTESEKYFYKRT